MKLFKRAAVGVFVFSLALPLEALPSIYEYDWIGGQLGFTGKIFLDAPSSGVAPHGGTDADVLAGSFVSTPLGTFSILDPGLDAAFGPAGAMSWDSSHISLMWLFFQPTAPINNPAYNLPGIGSALAGIPPTGNALEVGSLAGGFGTGFAYDDFSGSWTAVPVPEPAAVSLILLCGAATSVICSSSARRRRQKSA